MRRSAQPDRRPVGAHHQHAPALAHLHGFVVQVHADDRIRAQQLRLLDPDDAVEEDGGADAARHSFTGRDDWDSEPFEVTQPWRVTWQNEGSLLTVELRGEQGEMLDVIGNQIGRGGGRSEVQEPGVYRLAVRGLGGWRVQVVDE